MLIKRVVTKVYFVSEWVFCWLKITLIFCALFIKIEKKKLYAMSDYYFLCRNFNKLSTKYQFRIQSKQNRRIWTRNVFWWQPSRWKMTFITTPFGVRADRVGGCKWDAYLPFSSSHLSEYTRSDAAQLSIHDQLIISSISLIIVF